jgi:hypothetical protein
MDADEIQEMLDAFATEQGVVPADGYYITGSFNLTGPGGEKLYSDEAHEYCEECAEKLLAQALPLIPEDKRLDHQVCFTDLCGEESCANCAKCGKLLDYSLSSYGVASELDHFQQNPPTGSLFGETAFNIARMVESEPNDETVLAVARQAVEIIQAARSAATPA